jgi:hypothetical protein
MDNMTHDGFRHRTNGERVDSPKQWSRIREVLGGREYHQGHDPMQQIDKRAPRI